MWTPTSPHHLMQWRYRHPCFHTISLSGGQSVHHFTQWKSVSAGTKHCHQPKTATSTVTLQPTMEKLLSAKYIHSCQSNIAVSQCCLYQICYLPATSQTLYQLPHNVAAQALLPYASTRHTLSPATHSCQ